MKFKYLIILGILSLILTIGAVSAVQDQNNTNNNVSLDQNNDTIKTSTPTSNTQKITKTKVKCPDKMFLFKRNSNFKITIKDKKTNKAIKKLKISFKIKDNKKTKTYTLKTDKKGVTLFNTKKLSLGFHKFTIKSKNPNYKVSKKDKIFIGNLYKTTSDIGSIIKLNNGDAFYSFVQKKNGQFKKGVNTDVWYSGGANPEKGTPNPHYTQLYKAKFFFKNKKTGTIISVKSKGNLEELNGDIYRTLPYADLIKGYTPIQTKFWYLISQ